MLKPDIHDVKHIDFGTHEAQEHPKNQAIPILNLNDKDECHVQIFFNSFYKGPEAHWYCNEYHLHSNGLYMPRTTRVASVKTPIHQVKQWASQFRDKIAHTTTGKPDRWTRIQEWPVRFLKDMPTQHGWNVKIILHIQPIDMLPGSIKEIEIDEILRIK